MTTKSEIAVRLLYTAIENDGLDDTTMYLLYNVIDILKGDDEMTLDEYQKLAARTINPKLCTMQIIDHGKCGMVGEIGEIMSLYQKTYQGHPLDLKHVKKELGDLLWFIAEFATGNGWTLDDICTVNIEKLKARYPEGFDENLSKNRKNDDI